MTRDPVRSSHPNAAAVRTRHLPVPGARLFVRDVGAGPPLVVLHGGPEFSHDYFVPELDALAANARLVYYDQRGRGQSGDGVREDDVTIDSEMQDLEQLRQWLGSPTIALLGHSWGGLLAMEYAVRYPDRVTHIVLMNSVPASHRHFLLMREARNRLLGEQIEILSSLRDAPAYRSGDVETERQFLLILFQRACHDPAIAERLVPRFFTGMTPARIIRSRAIGQRLAEQGDAHRSLRGRPSADCGAPTAGRPGPGRIRVRATDAPARRYVARDPGHRSREGHLRVPGHRKHGSRIRSVA